MKRYVFECDTTRDISLNTMRKNWRFVRVSPFKTYSNESTNVIWPSSRLLLVCFPRRSDEPKAGRASLAWRAFWRRPSLRWPASTEEINPSGRFRNLGQSHMCDLKIWSGKFLHNFLVLSLLLLMDRCQCSNTAIHKRLSSSHFRPIRKN